MIAFLEGKLVEKHPTQIYIDVNGVGYEVHIPLSTFDRLPDSGQQVRLLTYLYVREDTQRLFGFSTLEEKEIFLLLLAVSGIGPSTALAVLSGSSVEEFKSAVGRGQEDLLTGIPGIGRKTARRIIVELKDKIAPGTEFISPQRGDISSDKEIIINDVLLALVSLGYKRNAARQVLEKIITSSPDKDWDAETLIRIALRYL